MQVLTFQYGMEHYCLRIEEVSEVVQDVPVVPLPRLPEQFEGIFQLRGRIVGLLSFPRCLDEKESTQSEIMVLAEPANHLALRVSGSVESLTLEADHLNAPPQETAVTKFLDGVFYNGQQIYHLLSSGKLLSHARTLIRSVTGEEEEKKFEL